MSTSSGEIALAIPMITDFVKSLLGVSDIKKDALLDRIARAESKGDVSRSEIASLIASARQLGQYSTAAQSAANELDNLERTLNSNLEKASNITVSDQVSKYGEGAMEKEKPGWLRFVDQVPIVGTVTKGLTHLLGVDSSLADQAEKKLRAEAEEQTVRGATQTAGNLYQSVDKTQLGQEE